MAKPIITISEAYAASGQALRIVKFDIPGGVTSPEEFAVAVAEITGQLSGNLPVLINGRGPVWGYGMLFHEAHPSPMVATYDPRLGYVVVQTHNEQFTVGQVIPDPEA